MPTNSVQALLAQDIPDPTDFSDSTLRQLDSSFRCTICVELFDAPISLACGHCFCSLCIREHISRESECPSCRKPASEAQFRVNPVLEEVVSTWKTARPTVLQFSQQARPQKVTRDETPRRFESSIQNGRKRRHTEVSPDSDVMCVAGPSYPRESSEIEDSSPLRTKSAPRKASRRRTDMVPSSDPREAALLELVECPVCGDSVEFRVINIHMDGPNCGQKPRSRKNNASSPHATQQWSRILGRNAETSKAKHKSESDDAMERLPKVSYDVLKDKALKDLLSSQQLPLNGDRNARIARHKRWVMMYNANLDKTGGRRTASELRLELRAWEEGQRAHKYVVDDPSAYEALHRDEFIRLAQEAREGRSRSSTLGVPSREGVIKGGHEEHD